MWSAFSNWKGSPQAPNASLICCLDAWNSSPAAEASEMRPRQSSVAANLRAVVGIWADPIGSETDVRALPGSPS